MRLRPPGFFAFMGGGRPKSCSQIQAQVGLSAPRRQQAKAPRRAPARFRDPGVDGISLQPAAGLHSKRHSQPRAAGAGAGAGTGGGGGVAPYR